MQAHMVGYYGLSLFPRIVYKPPVFQIPCLPYLEYEKKLFIQIKVELNVSHITYLSQDYFSRRTLS